MTTKYQQQLKADLEVLNPDWYLETDINLKGVKENFEGNEITPGFVQAIADGDYTAIYRNDPNYVELPSGAGFVWTG